MKTILQKKYFQKFREINFFFSFLGDDAGCSYCGGLGHRITACPKLEAANHKKSSNKRDYLKDNTEDY